MLDDDDDESELNILDPDGLSVNDDEDDDINDNFEVMEDD